MSDAERVRWETRYREGGYRARGEPFSLLTRWIDRLPRGRALDIAGGTGRNGRFLARHGYEVDVVDVSAAALEQGQAMAREEGLALNWIEADLDDHALPVGHYDVVVNCRYINRNLVPPLKAALRDGGYLLFDHHIKSHAGSITAGGSTDSHWRLAPGEALHLFWDLRILFFEEVLETEKDGRVSAPVRLVACKGDPGF